MNNVCTSHNYSRQGATSNQSEFPNWKDERESAEVSVAM